MIDWLKDSFSGLAYNPQKVHFNGMEQKEKILFVLRRHIITLVPSLLFVAGMAFLPFVVSFVFGLDPTTAPFLNLPVAYRFILLFLWYLLTFMFLYEVYLTWFFNVYIVTEKRIVDVDFNGLLSKQVSETPITNVQDVTYNIGGVFPTIFNYGDVHIQTAAEKREFEFEQVPNPSFVHDKVTDLVTGANGGHI